MGTTVLHTQAASWVISGNENKIDLTSGTPAVVPNAAPDSLSLFDFDEFPPKVSHLDNVPNSVIGPPSNIAISPDGRRALIADSVQIDPQDPTQFIPASRVHVLDLAAETPRVVGEVQVGQQPSGISFTPNGRLALVANRADGTVSVLAIEGGQVAVRATVEVCSPEESLSDVAIHPKGKLALASVQKGGYLSVLTIGPSGVEATDRKISVCGQPYRCVITPDGALGLTAGQGAGNGLDEDALTVVDLTADPIRTTDYVAIGPVPESIEVSPDGQLVAAVVMNGSNLAPGAALASDAGAVVLLERRGGTFVKVQELPVGRIPEGVAFTADGKYLLVQCHPARELWVFRVQRKRLADTGTRLAVPGMASALRAQSGL